MHSPLKLFGLREWATHRAEGHVCSTCGHGRLELIVPAESDLASTLRCNSCGKTSPLGWFRHHYNTTPPTVIKGQQIHAGPLFATIQHWARPPDGDPEQLQLADFYLDIDREDFREAVHAAYRYQQLLHEHAVAFHVGFSGQKGFWFQIPWQVVGAGPTPTLHEHRYRGMAQALQDLTDEPLDMRLYSQARMFRVTGTRHASSGLYKIGIVGANFEDARELARDPANHTTTVLDLRPNAFLNNLYRDASEKPATQIVRSDASAMALPMVLDQPPCIQQALVEGPPKKGTRNLLNINMAAFFMNTDPEQAVTWAGDVPGASSTPRSVRVAEMRSTLRWAQRANARFSCLNMQSLGLCDPRCVFYPISYQPREVPLHDPAHHEASPPSICP